MDIRSLVIHGGIHRDPFTGAVTVPIYQTSTYSQDGIGNHMGYEYSRTGNPTREALEKLMADLEGGHSGFAFGSGMAAISSILMLFKSGDHIIVSDDVYGGTFRVIDKVFRNYNLEYTSVNTSDLKDIQRAIKPNTKAIYVETPTNPLMKLTDIKAVSKLAEDYSMLTIVDNTFATPYIQRPLELGADIVLHSATKYLGGHSDLVAGIVVVKNKNLAEQMHFVQNSVGAVLGPFDSWLLIKGIKTLAIRMDRHIENAKKVVSWLEEQQWIRKIHYPGFGGMISFEVDTEARVNEILNNLKTITLAESLGGVESLISVPARMTHASIPAGKRLELGITNTLVRLSVGIEYVNDIIADLNHANIL